MINFNECTLFSLDKQFNLESCETLPALQSWLNEQMEISESDRAILEKFRYPLKQYVHDWNEVELLQRFIGPIFSLIDFSSRRYNLFAGRSLKGTVEGIELGGQPDGLIASGFRKPEKPYFCFQEYKKEKDAEGDPAGQVLAAMLVAQEINEHKHPIYGCYVRGALWYFLLLQGKQYAISDGYLATRDDLFDIFRILHGVKQIVLRSIEGG